MENTGWQREIGETVTAKYYGQSVTGVIAEKRVAYGGYVKLYIDVPEGFDFNGESRYECIVTEGDVVTWVR